MAPTARPTLRYARSSLPEGRCGEWTIERFEVRERTGDEAPAHDPRPHWARAEPGVYTRLRAGSVDYMTDLYEEWWSQRVAMEEAVRRGGDVLVTGLGLGMVADTILRASAGIRSVTVLEAAAEVVELVAPHLEAAHPGRLAIVRADAFTWTPPAGGRYDVVWHDIWPNPFDPRCVPESRELMVRYAPRADWQGSWALEYRRLAGLAD